MEAVRKQVGDKEGALWPLGRRGFFCGSGSFD